MNRSTVATVALALLLVAGMAPFIDMDVWHQMSLFREALRQGWIPYIDRFAYTPTISPTVHHEWGAGAIAYLVATCWGETGLQLLRLSLVLAIAVVAVRVARERGARVVPLQALAVVAIPMFWITLSLVRARPARASWQPRSARCEVWGSTARSLRSRACSLRTWDDEPACRAPTS